MCTHSIIAPRRRHHTPVQLSLRPARIGSPPRSTPHALHTHTHPDERGRRHENSSVAASSRVSSESAGGESGGGWSGLPPRLYAAPQRNAGLPRGQIGLSRRCRSRIGVFLAWFRPELGSRGGRREAEKWGGCRSLVFFSPKVWDLLCS